MGLMLSVPAALVCLGAVFTLFLAETGRRLIAGQSSPTLVVWALAVWAPAVGGLVIALNAMLPEWIGVRWNGLQLAGLSWRGDEPGYMLVLAGIACVWFGIRAFFARRGLWWQLSLLTPVLLGVILGLQALFGFTDYGAALVREIYLLVGAAVFVHLAVIELENGARDEPLKSLGDAVWLCKSFGLLLLAAVPLAVWQPLTLRAMETAPVWLFAWIALVLVHLVAGALLALQLARERAERNLHLIQTEDALTGLMSRQALIDEMEADLGRKDHFLGAFLVLQVDDFRGITDNHGRKDGDLVLVTLAGFLKTVAGTSMSCARLGEAEFGLYIPGLAGAPVALLAQQLCRGAGLVKPKIDGKPFNISVSIGFSDTQRSGKTFDTLYAHANCGLHEALRKGGNRCFAYSPDLKVKDIEVSMRKAIRLIA